MGGMLPFAASANAPPCSGLSGHSIRRQGNLSANGRIGADSGHPFLIEHSSGCSFTEPVRQARVGRQCPGLNCLAGFGWQHVLALCKASRS